MWQENGLKQMMYQAVNILSTRSFTAPVLRSDLCECSEAYIAVKGAIDLLAATANENDKV